MVCNLIVCVGPWIVGTGEPTAHRRCRPVTMARGRRREGEQSAHIHSTSTSVGRSSTEEMAKLNSLSLLSCSGKLYIQLYTSNPSTQICQTVMLLQWLDVIAGLTLAHAPAMATVRQGSLSTPAPVTATVQQQGSPFGACPCRAYRGEQ